MERIQKTHAQTRRVEHERSAEERKRPPFAKNKIAKGRAPANKKKAKSSMKASDCFVVARS